MQYLFCIFIAVEEKEEKEGKEDKEEKEENSEIPSEEKEVSVKEKSPEPEIEKPKKGVDSETVIDLANEKEPRALHKTSSIFLRNLAPTITKAEVEAVIILFFYLLPFSL
jgi:hypothetical protein